MTVFNTPIFIDMEICLYSIVDGKEDTYYIQNTHIYINIYLEISGKVFIKMLKLLPLVVKFGMIFYILVSQIELFFFLPLVYIVFRRFIIFLDK